MLLAEAFLNEPGALNHQGCDFVLLQLGRGAGIISDLIKRRERDHTLTLCTHHWYDALFEVCRWLRRNIKLVVFVDGIAGSVVISTVRYCRHATLLQFDVNVLLLLRTNAGFESESNGVELASIRHVCNMLPNLLILEGL